MCNSSECEGNANMSYVCSPEFPRGRNTGYTSRQAGDGSEVPGGVRLPACRFSIMVSGIMASPAQGKAPFDQHSTVPLPSRAPTHPSARALTCTSPEHAQDFKLQRFFRQVSLCFFFADDNKRYKNNNNLDIICVYFSSFRSGRR
jgi:hypothetical protein